jgi:2,4-didehydro-3-deoxy-L-rhamnonate hydrolase
LKEDNHVGFRRILWSSTVFFALLLNVEMASAQIQGYKLGMFEQNGRAFPGLLVDDALVVDLGRGATDAPNTLKEVIESWDASTAAEYDALAATVRAHPPSYSYPLSVLKVLPPLRDPDNILMAARNYTEHANEMAAVGRTSGTTSVIDESILVGIPGLWTRDPNDQRPNPYLFPKLKSSIVGQGDPILLPEGRTHIDYECELVAVIGRTASRVSVDQGLDYVFGYTTMVDVSDREDRADGRYGSDWLMGKSHDTFGPLGPFIVPAQFINDPQNLHIRYTLNNQLMQDGNSELMVHRVRDLVSYASNIATLRPGDLIGTGTPGGVGEGRTPPVYLKAGDQSACWIEGIGTLANPVQAQPHNL